MKKRFSAGFFVLIVPVLLLSLFGCSSESARKAEEAYERGDYDAVVQYLESEDTGNEQTSEMYLVSKAHVLEVSNDKVEAYSCLLEVDSEASGECKKELLDSIVADALTSGNAQDLVDVISIDESAGGSIVTSLKEGADSLNYNAFKCFECISSSQLESDAVQESSEYLDASAEAKMKSFLIGTWEWQCDDEVKGQVEIKANGAIIWWEL